MRHVHGPIVHLAVLPIVVLAAAHALAAPAACVKGTMITYLGESKECTIGTTTFVFHGYEGREFAKRADVAIEPLTDPPGFRFTFPKMTSKKFDFAVVRFTIHAKGPVVGSTIAGDLEKRGSVNEDLGNTETDPAKRLHTRLQLVGVLNKSMTGTLRKVSAKGLKAEYTVRVGGTEDPVTSAPVFSTTFTIPAQ